MLGSQEVRRRPVKPETAGSNPAPAANEAAFWRAVDAQPDCVRCGGKCHSKRGGLEQHCYWCKSILRAYPSRVGRIQVRVWEREVML